jgi:uncharacterized membrane protein YdjX (TVP38/TMEM64 family)
MTRKIGKTKTGKQAEIRKIQRLKRVNSKKPIPKSQDQKSDLKKIWQSVRTLLFFILLLILIPKIEEWIGTDNIKNFINSLGIWAPIAFIVVRLVTVVIAPLKLGPVTIILHRAFGLWPSIFYAILVTVVGSCINFLISKRWGNKIIGFFFGPDILALVDKYAQKYLNTSLKNTTALFLASYELSSYASGLTDIKFRRVFLASLLSSLITAPLLVVRDLSIGNNDFLATVIFVLSYIFYLGPLFYVAGDDIKKWWKSEMERIKNNAD